jgi:hypothetical protein
LCFVQFSVFVRFLGYIHLQVAGSGKSSSVIQMGFKTCWQEMIETVGIYR